jgi:hypothetical protein
MTISTVVWKTTEGYAIQNARLMAAKDGGHFANHTSPKGEGFQPSPTRTLRSTSIGSVELQPGQSLTNENGKAEISLTPGVFLRVGDNSAVQLVSTRTPARLATSIASATCVRRS